MRPPGSGHYRAWKNGLIIRALPTGALGYAPPLCCSESDIEAIVERTAKILDETLGCGCPHRTATKIGMRKEPADGRFKTLQVGVSSQFCAVASVYSATAAGLTCETSSAGKE